MHRGRLWLILSVIGLAACTAEPGPARAVRSSQAGIGETGSTDAADRECRLVLRWIGRVPGDNDYRTDCSSGVCNYVWQSRIDVAEEAAFPAGTTVHVLYHLSGDADWWEMEAAELGDDGLAGFRHYGVDLSEHLFGPDLSAEAQAETRIEIIPFVRLPDGSRWFDHNRMRDDFDVYTLTPEYLFGTGDGGVCQPVAGSVHFFDTWEEYQSNNLHAGGYLVIDYDLDRLPQCRATHNGYPAWDTVASVRFLPGGRQVDGSVRVFETEGGVPTNVAHARQLDVKIPDDATAVEIWFHNYSGAGNFCDAWDSNYGANYRFEVLPPVSHPRCRDVESWSSIYGGTETCVGYDLDEQADATHCELYLNGFGHGHEGHYGIPFDWLEAYVTVGPQDGEVLNVGMFTRYYDPRDDASHDRFSLGTAIEPGYYKTGFTYHYTGYMGGGSYSFGVERVAFFVDVRRPSGTVVRLWQSRGGGDYTWDDAFGLPTSTSYIPYGNVQYANDGAAVFDAKRACQ